MQLKVEKATPVYLLDICKPYASSYFKEYINGETITMGGSTYTNGFSLNDEGYAIFNLSGNYSAMNFTIGHIDNTTMRDGVVKVYCDGVLTKEITIGCEALPQRINLDITGVKQIKFEFPYVRYHNVGCGFANVIIK